jgi:predicted nucleic acid-binding protein
MIYLDSWVWIEFFSRGDSRDEAEEVISQLQESGAVISTAVLMEVGYILRRKYGEERANAVIAIIEAFEEMHILPVSNEVAVYAASLRDKYNRDGRQFSYGDAIHLATAVLTGCETLYSGDPDFLEVTELEIAIIGFPNIP